MKYVLILILWNSSGGVISDQVLFSDQHECELALEQVKAAYGSFGIAAVCAKR